MARPEVALRGSTALRRGTAALIAALIAVAAALAAVPAFADAGEEAAGQGRRAAAVDKPEWAFALTAYPTAPRDGDDYVTAIAAADRGPLHLEARVNYEAIGARSAFVGWTFSGGDTLSWELTPMLGGAWGSISAFVPALEASLAWGRFDVYVEAEYVREGHDRSDAYTYAWSELGFKPLPWLRLGAAGQRTKVYASAREFQRGPFVQATWGRVTAGGYWFNPGSSAQVFVGMLSLAF